MPARQVRSSFPFGFRARFLGCSFACNEDDDADLYDPDDPASDWGQVVQEAALATCLNDPKPLTGITEPV